MESKKVIASFETANYILFASMQQDSYFGTYFSIDECFVAYLVCGMCCESGESVM